jgi:hypothetical protein
MLNNVPLTGQNLGVTRVPINTNFSTINTAFTVNHVQYNDGSGNQGMHNFVQMPIPASTPTTGVGQVGLYAQTSTITSQPELVFSHQSGSTAPTGAKIVEFTSAGWANPGWARLPSGILLKWGQASMPSGGSSGANPPVVYPTGATIPAFNQVFQVILSQAYTASQTTLGSNGFGLHSSSTTQFTVTWSGNNGSNTILTYLAIGV